MSNEIAILSFRFRGLDETETLQGPIWPCIKKSLGTRDLVKPSLDWVLYWHFSVRFGSGRLLFL